MKEPTGKHPNPAKLGWMKREMRKPFRIMFWVLVVLMGVGLVGNLMMFLDSEDKVTTNSTRRNKTRKVSEKRKAANTQREERTPEHNLAIIHEGWKVPGDHTTVFRFRYLLQQLDTLCIQSKQEIADMTVKAQQVIREERGIKMSLLSMMEEMNKTMMVYRPEGGGDYAELLAAEMVLWMEGL